MKKRLTSIIAAAALVFALCGCGSLYDKEYIAVSDYVPPAQPENISNEGITVRTFAGLKQALLSFVSDGKETGRITFDTAYEGDLTEDLASACWQVRTQNAMCAYCVENISYELTRIVTYYEAQIQIKYTSDISRLEKIEQLSYSFGIDDVIKRALEEGRTRVAVLIGVSSYSAENVELAVTRIYRENPLITPREPKAGVNMYSGTNRQRLYEINIDYSASPEELAGYKQEIAKFDPISEAGFDAANEGQISSAKFAFDYIADNCELSRESQFNTASAALINKCANSEGIAFAYVELCHRLGLDCRIVYGQKNWEDHCWNIIRIDGEYYHVDVSAVMSGEAENGFLLGDENMWGTYRWDVSAYPACASGLNTAEADG